MTEGSASAAVRVVELVKRYPERDTNAVDGISFEVEQGEVFGLLGPNGAGKTTTIRIMCTRLAPTSGTVLIDGVDIRRNPVEARARLAVVPQRSNLDRALTPRQNLLFHAAYHGVGRVERRKRAAELLEQFGLAEEADVKLDWYSGGMAQRLMIARALMHEPRVLFLDESTTALDPQARLFFWERVRTLRNRGVAVILSTHRMDEASDMADRVAIIDGGRLLAVDNPQALTDGLVDQTTLDLAVQPGPSDDVDDIIEALQGIVGVQRAERNTSPPPGRFGGGGGGGGRRGGRRGGGGGRWAGLGGALSTLTGVNGSAKRLRLYLSTDAAEVLGPVATVLAARSATLVSVRLGSATLEDVFIGLTGKGLR